MTYTTSGTHVYIYTMYTHIIQRLNRMVEDLVLIENCTAYKQVYLLILVSG